MQLKMGSAVVSTAPVGITPTSWQDSRWRTNRWLESAAPSVRRDAEQSDRDGCAPLFRLHRSGLVGWLQFAVIVPASLAYGVGLAPVGVSFLDEAERIFDRDAILFGLVVVKHRGGHN